MAWTRERIFPTENQQSERSRASLTLDYLEKITDKLDQTPKLAHITLVATLNLDIRLPEWQ